MMKKERNLRLALSGVLLLAVVAAGIAMYRIDNSTKNEDPTKNIELAEEAPLSEAEDYTKVEEEPGEELESADANTDNVEAMPEEAPTAEDAVPEEADAAASQAVEEVLPALDFNEGTVTAWPVAQGDVLIDYSMDASVYFPTLEVYKYNPALIISSPADQEVLAMANSKVVAIDNNAETGTTVTMDMGNGYQAVYGQLKDVTLEVDQTVEEGAVIGTIAEPTKYYSTEGTNLYLRLSKDGETLDPMMYLPTNEE